MFFRNNLDNSAIINDALFMKKRRNFFDAAANRIKEDGVLSQEDCMLYADVFEFYDKTCLLWAKEILPHFNGTLTFSDDKSLELLKTSLADICSIISKHKPDEDFSFLLQKINSEPVYVNDILRGVITSDEELAASQSDYFHIRQDIFIFAAVNWLKPLFVVLKNARSSAEESTQTGRCPFCGCAPDIGVFMEEEHGRQYLRCSLCETLWAAPRFACPNCGETDISKLELFIPEDSDRYRLNACGTCKSFIKSVCVHGGEETEDFDFSTENLLTLSVDVEMLHKGYGRA